jgi:hypothetical protein
VLFFNLVKDRALADVVYARQIFSRVSNGTATEAEKAQFLSGLKGAYNSVDINRVESAVEFVRNLLQSAPLDVRKYAADRGVAWSDVFAVDWENEKVDITTKNNWDFSDFFDGENQQRYLRNVIIVADVLNIDSSELPTSFVAFGYSQANAIEQALDDAMYRANEQKTNREKLINNTALIWVQAGETFLGE